LVTINNEGKYTTRWEIKILKNRSRPGVETRVTVSVPNRVTDFLFVWEKYSKKPLTPIRHRVTNAV